MKFAKKLSALLLVVILACSMLTPAFAATIKVDNAVEGVTYSAYKIFDVTTTADGSGYAYTIKSDSQWYDDVSAYAATANSGLTLTASSTYGLQCFCYGSVFRG